MRRERTVLWLRRTLPRVRTPVTYRTRALITLHATRYHPIVLLPVDLGLSQINRWPQKTPSVVAGHTA